MGFGITVYGGFIEVVSNIPISQSNDKRIWCWEFNGEFSTKSYYRLFFLSLVV